MPNKKLPIYWLIVDLPDEYFLEDLSRNYSIDGKLTVYYLDFRNKDRDINTTLPNMINIVTTIQPAMKHPDFIKNSLKKSIEIGKVCYFRENRSDNFDSKILNIDELIGLGSICNSGRVIIKGCTTILVDNELEKSLSDFIKKSLNNSTFSFCGEYTPGEIKRLVEDFFFELPNDI